MTIQKTTTSSTPIQSASIEKVTDNQDDVKSEERHQTMMLDPGAQNSFAKFCARSPHKPHMVLSAAWAVVLHRFTETDNVTFALFGAQGVTKHTGLCRDAGQTYRITLGPAMAVRQLMCPKIWQVSEYAVESTSLNTALFVGSDVAEVYSQRLFEVIAPDIHNFYIEN
jgi:hypothetical protein